VRCMHTFCIQYMMKFPSGRPYCYLYKLPCNDAVIAYLAVRIVTLSIPFNVRSVYIGWHPYKNYMHFDKHRLHWVTGLVYIDLI
jgi:hypothetical protein